MNIQTAIIITILVLVIASYALIRACAVIEWLKEKLMFNLTLRKYNIYLLAITAIMVLIVITNINHSIPKEMLVDEIPKSSATPTKYTKSTPKEYIKGSDTIRIIGLSSDSYDLHTNRELNKSDIQLLKNALTYMDLNLDYTSFLYLKGKQGEDYYASSNGMSIHPKVTKETLNENLLSDLKSGMTITSKGNIIFFFDKIEKAKTAINNNSVNKEEMKKVLSQFQKLHFTKVRKAYYQNTKEELWEKDIEVELSGRSITFISYHFSANKVIKDTYLEIKDELTKLRFKIVAFKAFDGDDKTYWELDAKNDSEI